MGKITLFKCTIQCTKETMYLEMDQIKFKNTGFKKFEVILPF